MLRLQPLEQGVTGVLKLFCSSKMECKTSSQGLWVGRLRTRLIEKFVRERLGMQRLFISSLTTRRSPSKNWTNGSTNFTTQQPWTDKVMIKEPNIVQSSSIILKCNESKLRSQRKLPNWISLMKSWQRFLQLVNSTKLSKTTKTTIVKIKKKATATSWLPQS